MTEGYCVKCRKKQPISGGHNVTLKNGRAAIKGVCPTCNCKMFRMGKL